MRTLHLLLFALLAPTACGGGDRAAREARPIVERFLAGLDTRSPAGLGDCVTSAFSADVSDAALRPVLETMHRALGRRTGTESPSGRLDRSGASLDLVMRTLHERGQADVEVRAVRGESGGWLVDACVIRSPAFTWILREPR